MAGLAFFGETQMPGALVFEQFTDLLASIMEFAVRAPGEKGLIAALDGFHDGAVIFAANGIFGLVEIFGVG